MANKKPKPRDPEAARRQALAQWSDPAKRAKLLDAWEDAALGLQAKTEGTAPEGGFPQRGTQHGRNLGAVEDGDVRDGVAQARDLAHVR